MIQRAITRAYQTMADRNWNTIYWAIDLHGTCLKSNYKSTDFEFVNQECIDALRFISSLPETSIIIWSSCHDRDIDKVWTMFKEHGIIPHYFNENTAVENTATGNFSSKFYFSVLLDDKAGFNPETDWMLVKEQVEEERKKFRLK
jgi:hypothetical protein